MVRHWTPKPVIISCIRSSPAGENFSFAVVNSFEYNNAISANFVQTVKNSNVYKFLFTVLILYLVFSKTQTTCIVFCWYNLVGTNDEHCANIQN